MDEKLQSEIDKKSKKRKMIIFIIIDTIICWMIAGYFIYKYVSVENKQNAAVEQPAVEQPDTTLNTELQN